MEFKSIDTLSITECCEQLNLRREDLPEALQEVIEPSERGQLLIEQLRSLLDEDKLAIESCRTIEQYEGYLSTWVDGLYHSHARTRIAQLKAEAEELAFYQENKDSISGCEAYLQKYPNGKYVSDIQSILDQKKKARKTRNIILLVLLLIAAGIFAYSNYVPVSYVNVDDNAELNNLGSEISLDISTDAISSTITATSSEDWIDCRVSGKTLYISANTNPKGERSATVTITAHSSFFGNELSDRKQETITISQETGYASHLSVSNDDIYLTANGGTSSISINTDGIFVVSTAPASWVSTTIKGKTLNFDYSENLGTVRNSYLIISSGSKSQRINISQAGKTATHINVSSDNISYSYSGGTRTITVSTDGEWQISTGTAGWGHTSISGNTITLRVDENTSSSSRTDYFVIKSGSKEKRINISQYGKPATRLSVSTENVSFGKDGGSRTITVSTNGKWEIGVGTASWGHTSISGNTITLRVDKNNTGDERTDYFTVVAGDKKVRINITQAGGPSAEVNRVWVEHNIPRTGYNTVGNVYMGWQQVPYTYNVMRIHIDFDVNNMKGKTIRVCAFFFDEDGDELTTSNNQFRAPDGQVTVQNTGTATYENSNWSDYVLEIPYGVMRKGSNKFYIQIQDNRGNTLTTSSYEYFTVN